MLDSELQTNEKDVNIEIKNEEKKNKDEKALIPKENIFVLKNFNPKWKLKICAPRNGNESTEMVDGGKDVEAPSSELSTKDIEADKKIPKPHTTVKSPSSSRGCSMIDALTPKELPAKRKIKRKSFEVVTYTSPANKKTKGSLRSDCPPFCKSNCTFTHHPLLVCARKMIENDSETTMMFLDAVASYYGGNKGNMNPSDLIFDPWKNTELPLLHYLALMGKCAGCFAMIDAGHSPEKVISKNGDTVLHTLVKDMYLFNCTHGHMDILLKKFNLLLKEFKDCLLLTDELGRSPLHLCAMLIQQNSELLKSSSKQPFRLYQFQKNMLTAMLEQCKIQEFDSSMLNNIDESGNTFSHYIAEDRATSDILDEVKILGADFNICNNEGKTINEVMEQAAPLPHPKVLEMAAYSAKGKKYKATNRKPVMSPDLSLKTNASAKKPVNNSPKKTKRQKDSIKTAQITPIKSVDSQFTTDDKPVLMKTETIEPSPAELKPQQPIQTNTTAKLIVKAGKARVKITPTRKEKQERKVKGTKFAISENDTSVKENVVDSESKIAPKSESIITLGEYIQTTPISVVTPSSLIKSKAIVPKSVLVAISTANSTIVASNLSSTISTFSNTAPTTTLKIQDTSKKNENAKVILPTASLSQTSTLSMVAKVKPLTPSNVSQTKVDERIESKTVSDKSAMKVVPNAVTPVQTLINTMHVNKVTPARTDITDPRQYLPVYLNNNDNNLVNQANSLNPIEKPMYIQTSDGKLVQLSTIQLNSVSNQSHDNGPRHPVYRPNQNVQAMPASQIHLNQQFRMVVNQRLNAPQMVPSPHNMARPPRPININGQWVYPMINDTALFPQMRYAQPHRQMPPQPMVSPPPPSMGSSPSMVSPPHPPASMLSPPPPMIKNNLTAGMPPMNTFFPPHSQIYAQAPIITPLRPPPMPVGVSMLQSHSSIPTVPVNQVQNPNLTIVKSKRAQNLEANIRNLKAVSMDIISTQSTKPNPIVPNNLPLNQFVKSPTTTVLPTEEPVPPVYIIDTDDEQVIFRDDSPKKREEVVVEDHKIKETNDNVNKESTPPFVKMKIAQEKILNADFYRFTNKKRQALMNALDRDKQMVEACNFEMTKLGNSVQHISNLIAMKEKEIVTLSAKLHHENEILNNIRTKRTNLMTDCNQRSKRLKELDEQARSFETSLSRIPSHM